MRMGGPKHLKEWSHIGCVKANEDDASHISVSSNSDSEEAVWGS